MSTATQSPWDIDISQFHRNSKAYKEVMEARKLVPEPEKKKPEEEKNTGGDQPPVVLPTTSVPPAQKLEDVLPQQRPTNEAVRATTTQESPNIKFLFPDKVLIKPIALQANRLGLEKQKENYLRMPGTLYTWEPSIRGKNYRTGLNKVSPEQLRELEEGVGQKLDNDYYVELRYRMDGSNPHGHHMSLSTAREKVIYLAMLESHLIANGLHEYSKGVKPEAEWYIENQEAEVEQRSVEKDQYNKIYDHYRTISMDRKVLFAKILGIAVRGLSPAVADTRLYDKINSKEQGWEAFRKRYVEIMEWSDEKVNVFAEVEDAIASNIIRRNNAQDYIYADEVLGSTKDQVMNKLLGSENASLRIAIRSKLAIR